MRVKGDGIFSINTSASGGFGSAGISLPEAVADASGGADSPPITDNLSIYFNPDVEVYSDAGTTLAVDGDNIRQYNDQSGNSNTAEHSTASVQPIYKTSVLGGGNASIFTGSNDRLNLTSTIVIPDLSSWTFYTVYKRDPVGDWGVALGNASGAPSANIIFRSIGLRASDDSNQYSYIWNAEDTTLKIMTVVVDSSANTISLYKNNTLVQTQSLTYSDTFTFKNLYFHSGLPTPDTNWGNMLLYTDLHDATQVGEVNDWLNTKYSIY